MCALDVENVSLMVEHTARTAWKGQGSARGKSIQKGALLHDKEQSHKRNNVGNRKCSAADRQPGSAVEGRGNVLGAGTRAGQVDLLVPGAKISGA